VNAATVIQRLGYDASFGSTHNAVHAAAILAAQGGSLEQVSAMRDSDLRLTWG